MNEADVGGFAVTRPELGFQSGFRDGMMLARVGCHPRGREWQANQFQTSQNTSPLIRRTAPTQIANTAKSFEQRKNNWLRVRSRVLLLGSQATLLFRRPFFVRALACLG
jgi:hypothetical protein